MSEGVKIRRPLAVRMEAATESVEGMAKDGGRRPAVGGDAPREPRCYMSPGAGIDEPADQLTPSDAMCELYVFNGITKAFEPSGVMEQVFSRVEIAGNRLFESYQLNGHTFAVSPGETDRKKFLILQENGGGAIGTATTKSTWLYSITDALSGEPLTTAPIDPTTPPHTFERVNGAYDKATFGLGYLNTNNPPELVITHVFEPIEGEECNP